MKIGNFPRKQFFVDTMQYRIIGVSLLYLVATVLVFTGVLFIPLMIELNSDSLASPAVQEAAKRFLYLHARIWPPVMILVGLLIVHNTIVSHRIAGPLFRIRHELKKIGDGNLFVQVKLRKNDYLDKEADSVNSMVSALRGKVQGIEQSQRRASSVLVDLQRAVMRGAADDMSEKIDELNATLEALRDNVDQFQIPRPKKTPVDPVVKVENKSEETPVGAGSTQTT
jgi:methyl-accepting chemotaxis protein